MQTVAVLSDANTGFKSQKSVALVSPTFDALFVCGLIPFAFGLIAHFGIGVETNGLTVQPIESAFVIPYMVASLLIGESHQFTSIIRYFSKSFKAKQFQYDRLAIRFIYLVVGLALAAVILQGLFVNPFISVPFGFFGLIVGIIAAIAIQLFPAFLAHHVLAQSRAIGLMYCGKRGYELTPRQIELQSGLMLILVATAATSFAQPFTAPFLKLTLDFSLATQAFTASSVALACAFAAVTIKRGLSTNEWPPELACLLWISNLLLFILPVEISMFAWLFAPVFMHATQHWSVAWSVRKNELAAKGQAPVTTADKCIQLLAMTSPAIALTLLVLFSPLLISGTTMGTNTLSAVPSMFIFYFHYLTDRIVWRRA